MEALLGLQSHLCVLVLDLPPQLPLVYSGRENLLRHLGPPTASAPGYWAAGLMFWFMWKRFLGSYLRLISASLA
jgi:hypothetical protein